MIKSKIKRRKDSAIENVHNNISAIYMSSFIRDFTVLQNVTLQNFFIIRQAYLYLKLCFDW